MKRNNHNQIKTWAKDVKKQYIEEEWNIWVYQHNHKPNFIMISLLTYKTGKNPRSCILLLWHSNSLTVRIQKEVTLTEENLAVTRIIYAFFWLSNSTYRYLSRNGKIKNFLYTKLLIAELFLILKPQWLSDNSNGHQ